MLAAPGATRPQPKTATRFIGERRVDRALWPAPDRDSASGRQGVNAAGASQRSRRADAAHQAGFFGVCVEQPLGFRARFGRAWAGIRLRFVAGPRSTAD